jgi:hypothetical protein
MINISVSNAMSPAYSVLTYLIHNRAGKLAVCKLNMESAALLVAALLCPAAFIIGLVIYNLFLFDLA